MNGFSTSGKARIGAEISLSRRVFKSRLTVDSLYPTRIPHSYQRACEVVLLSLQSPQQIVDSNLLDPETVVHLAWTLEPASWLLTLSS